jgi:hypothetical protein
MRSFISGLAASRSPARDKTTAGRRKGKWVGGMPVLGYDIVADGVPPNTTVL